MRIALVVVGVLGACATESQSSFEYNATVDWLPAARPDVVAITADGEAVPPGGFVLARTFASFDEARAATIPVEVTTTDTVIHTFAIVPTRCGTGGCNLTGVTREDERWELSRTEPLAFQNGIGSC